MRRHLRRFLLAAACASVAAATPTVTAVAATDPCAGGQPTGLDPIITVYQPGPDTSPADAHQCTPVAGSTVNGSWSIRFDAASVSSLRSFSVSIAPADPAIPPLPASATTSRTYGSLLSGNPKLSDTIQMPWDTGSLSRYNGTYQISATAVSLLGATTHALVDHLVVNNPPGRPVAPGATVNGTVPELSWTANAEPDLTGYRILRSVAGGAYAPVGTSPAASFRDTGAPQNKQLTYEVVAVRRSALDPAGIASDASPAGSPLTVTPPLPPPVAPAPVAKSLTKSTIGNAPAVDPGSSTFAPTLPFAQAVPTATATLPDVAPSGNAAAALPAGYTKTTLVQKLPFLGAAVAIALIAFFIVRYARRLGKGDA